MHEESGTYGKYGKREDVEAEAIAATKEAIAIEHPGHNLEALKLREEAVEIWCVTCNCICATIECRAVSTN